MFTDYIHLLSTDRFGVLNTMSWPRLGVIRVVTVFDTNENRGKECERLGKITERKGFENSVPDNVHSFPVISPMGTSQSHDLEHCECTVHVPAGVITGKLSGKFKMYLQCSRWAHCWYTVHFLVMYLQCSCWEHHYLPPVRAGGLH